MKNIFKYISIIALTLSVLSCEKVVDVDLDTAPPKLVVEAAINWEKGTSGANQKIKLTTTSSYFGTTIPVVSGATVFITDSNSTVFNFTETPNTGEYLCNTFIPVLNQNYTLTVAHNGKIFTASETLKPVPAIDFIEQNNAGGITGQDIEIKTFFTDPRTTDDFYMARIKANFLAFPTYEVTEDKYFQGNQIFQLYIHEKLAPGNELDIKLYGISQRYFNYMSILLSIAGSNSGNPFQSPPATVHGNIVNTANTDDFALGYFSLSETDTEHYVVK